jgi:hypothetical protein
MKLGVSIVQVGIAAGLIAAACCGWSEIQRLGPGIASAVLVGCLSGGVVSVLAWGNDLRGKCDRYEKLLRQHGIDPGRGY